MNHELVDPTRGDGEPRTSRGVFSYALPVVFVFLLFVSVMVLDPHAAVAQQTQDLMEEGGRDIGAIDWLYHLPLALGVVLLVVTVDVIVIIQVLRGRRGRE